MNKCKGKSSTVKAVKPGTEQANKRAAGGRIEESE